MNIIKYKASEFATQNLILPDGYFGLETDTRKLKLGNGATPWNSLSYFTSGGSGGGTWGSITGTLSEQTDLQTIIDSLSPRVNSTFIPATGMQLDRLAGTFYNTYAQAGVLELIIASGHISSGCAMLPIIVDGALITITGATIDPKSDVASTNATDVDNYVFWEDETGVWYSITNRG